MDERKKVLILTVDAGFGHRSAANAIAMAFSENYGASCQVEVNNPLDDRRAPAMLRRTQTGHDKLVSQMPDIYKFQYDLTGTTVVFPVISQALVVLLYNIIKETIRAHQPDVIVTTHPYYLAPLSAIAALSKKPVPFITVVTDLTNVHRLWFQDTASLTLVPTQEAFQQGLLSGIPGERLRVTGIPINPNINRETRSVETLRIELGWNLERTTLLVAGSKRVKHLENVLHELNHADLPIQLVLVAGGDDRLYDYFSQVDWHLPVHIYNFVDCMPQFLHAVDGVIGKAGGLIVTESLACGLPLLLIDITPGTEDGNADFVLKHGAADYAANPGEALEILRHWLANDKHLLLERHEKSLALGRVDSAYMIADCIYEVMEKGWLPKASPQYISKIRQLLQTVILSSEKTHVGRGMRKSHR